MRWVWLLSLCVGCAPKSNDPAVRVWGTLTTEAGDVATAGGTGFAFDSVSNGQLALFIPGASSATCSDVGRSLANDRELDPGVLTPAGTCSIFLYAAYSAPESTTWFAAPATVVLNCAFGEGSWSQSADCDGGYCFSGHFWTGAPGTFEATVSGGDGADYSVDLDLSRFSGQFPYESLETSPLEGEVSGAGEAIWCPDIGESAYF
jgi:hypothetical protein